MSPLAVAVQQWFFCPLLLWLPAEWCFCWYTAGLMLQLPCLCCCLLLLLLPAGPCWCCAVFACLFVAVSVCNRLDFTITKDERWEEGQARDKSKGIIQQLVVVWDSESWLEECCCCCALSASAMYPPTSVNQCCQMLHRDVGGCGKSLFAQPQDLSCDVKARRSLAACPALPAAGPSRQAGRTSSCIIFQSGRLLALLICRKHHPTLRPFISLCQAALSNSIMQLLHRLSCRRSRAFGEAYQAGARH